MERFIITVCLLLFGWNLPAQIVVGQPSDSLSIKPYRGLEIEGETIICPGATTVLKVKGPYVKYEWSTGQQTPAIPVFKPGTYGVTVTTKGGCQLTGSVTVRYSASPCL
ncbi:MAG: hypothetical protein IPL65_11340 [Lewinellaceae bacterium]|nr:hypothetical protein [Lewinellaceae bacterium]